MTPENQSTAMVLRLARLEDRCAEIENKLAKLNEAEMRAAQPIEPKLMDLVEAAARLFDIETAILRTHRRIAWLVPIRHKVMHLIRNNSATTYRQIGQAFGADYSVVIHACRSVQNRIDTEPRFAEEMEQWRQRFLKARAPKT
jgi:chromosomal replication initiation ATPase DnaA